MTSMPSSNSGAWHDAYIQNAFAHYGLRWPECIDALDYALACDLQVDEAADPNEPDFLIVS
jgi:hypothetical protein